MASVLIFTGKGGVGKSSVAAAHGRKASLLGKKTLIVSTDMAHSLGDIFECELGREALEVSPGLWGLEIDPNYEMNHDFASMMAAFETMFPPKGDQTAGDSTADMLSMLPGIEALFSLLKIHAIYQKGQYDLMIVDCAPTGETLSLLKFPELLSWYMERLFPLGKVAMKVMSPVSKALFKIQLPDGKAMNDIERFYLKLAALQGFLRNREICSIRLVAIPEKMVVEETKRSYMYLNLYNFGIDGLYINRVLPSDIDNDFFDEWIPLQKGYIDELSQVFGSIPIYPIKWYDTDLNGLAALDRVCKDSLTAPDLFKIQSQSQNEVYEKTASGYQLRLQLPGATKDKLLLHDAGTELIVRIGNFKRNIPLPGVLRSYAVAAAKLEDGLLTVDFGRCEHVS